MQKEVSSDFTLRKLNLRSSIIIRARIEILDVILLFCLHRPSQVIPSHVMSLVCHGNDSGQTWSLVKMFSGS